MTILSDEKEYEVVSAAFLRKFVTSFVSHMHESEYIDFDVYSSDEEENINKVFTTCFQILINFEEFGGFTSSSDRYYAHCLFAKSPRSPDEYLTSQRRTDLHGGVTDELISSVIKAIKSSKKEGRRQ